MSAAFNIKVGYGDKEVTLTILPATENYFKLIYFGGLMGAVCFNGGEWELIQADELEPGDLPLYKPDLKGDRLQLSLNEATVEEIGAEIESYFSREELG